MHAIARAAVALSALASPLSAEPPDGTPLWGEHVPFGTPPGSQDAGGQSVAVQADGRIVVAGFIEIAPQIYAPALARLLENGELDPSFGADGRVVNPIPGETDRMEPQAVALEPGSGRILVAGRERLPANESKGFVLRLLPDGSPDPTFDGDGLRRVVFSLAALETTSLAAVAGAADGTVMVAGSTYSDQPGESGYRFAIARLVQDGELDPGFDGDGLQTVAFAGGYGRARALVRQSDGGALVAGVGTPVNTATDAVVVRLLVGGGLDPAFGVGGRAAVNWALVGSSDDGAAALALSADGRIVLGGYACSHQSFQGFCDRTTWAVARLLADGSPDPAFGTAGRVHGPLCEPPSCALYSSTVNGLAARGDARILFTGDYSREPELDLDFGVFRLLDDGNVDSGFGAGGVASVDLGSAVEPRQDWSVALTLAPDGRVVVAGQSGGAGGFEFGIARLASALVFADGFDAGSADAWSGLAP